MEQDKTKIKDYSDEERYNRKRARVTALLKWLECEFFGVFIFLSLFGISPMLGKAGNVIFAILGIVCYIGVLSDFGMKEGSKARVKNTVRGDDVKQSFGIVLGLIAMLPALVSYIILLLSYFGVIGSAVLPFKILNSGLWGLINIFVQDMKITHMSVHLLWVYPIVLLIYPLTVFIAFKLSFNNVDVQRKIMYKD